MLYVRGDSVLQWTDRRTDRQTDGQTGVMGVFRCVCALLCVCVSVSVCVKLLDEAVAFSGPSGSLFGFSLDFHTINNRSFVVIGAPKASTNQSGVEEGGAVYLCPWTTGEMTSSSSCNVVNFEAAGDQQTYSSDGVLVQTFRSHQWFGASLRSLADGQLLACAPLFHWNVHRWGEESGRTPVGTCLVLDQRTGDSAPFSPCRATLVEEDYKRMKNRNDQRYCEVGFSADITQDGRLLFGAPGSFYFQGQVFAVTLRDLLSSGRSSELRPFLQQPIGVSQSDERGDYDVYRGYSVASGQLTGDSTPDLLVGVPNDRNTAGTVTVYDGRSQGALRVVHTFLGAQVASYFGHSVSVADVNSDGMDDVLIGAPLFMTRVTEQLQERGQVVLYLQRNRGFFGPRPDQSLDGFTVYGRFGSALAPLGDLDMDGYQDVAVGAPWSGDGGRGQVFIYLGKEGGLSATPTQVIDSPTASGGRAAFGFALRGGVDIDGNGFPDLLVGGWAADRAFVYRSRAVIGSRLSLTLLPDFLQPEVRECQLLGQLVTCFLVKMCIHLSGHRIPEQTDVGVELQLDRMKQPIARRTLLLSTNQPQGSVTLAVPRDVGVACTNWTAYLRPEEEVRDKLSPIFITAEVNLLNSTHNALLHGQTYTATQTRIILDCGEDNVCVPDLQLSVAPASRSVLVGADQSVKLLVRAENRGEGAYETELLVQIPEHTHFQSSQGVNRLVCVQRKHNHTVVVICDLGNPMRQGHTVQTGLLFSVGGLEDVHSHINFSLVIRSKNPSSSNQVTVSVWVEAAAALEIRGGSSPPEVVLSLPDWLPAVHAGSGEEEAEGGVLVEHVYEVRNLGPATVNGRLTVHFPSTWRHHFLLLVSPNASQEALSCRSLNASHAHLPPSSGSRVPAVAQWDQQGETVTVNCSSSDAGCVRFVCDFTGLRRGFSSVVRISATLWTHTLIQTPYLNYELVSSAFYDVINVSSRVQPLQLPSGNTQTQLRVLWRPPGERDVPIGYMLLSVMAGLLLLSMLSLIFWKLGFFQRTRPPTDDDEDQCVCEEAPMTG